MCRHFDLLLKWGEIRTISSTGGGGGGGGGGVDFKWNGPQLVLLVGTDNSHRC